MRTKKWEYDKRAVSIVLMPMGSLVDRFPRCLVFQKKERTSRTSRRHTFIQFIQSFSHLVRLQVVSPFERVTLCYSYARVRRVFPIFILFSEDRTSEIAKEAGCSPLISLS